MPVALTIFCQHRPDDLRHLLTWLATDELPRRLELRATGQRVGMPHVLAIDELPAIVAEVKDAPEHLGRILREGRKGGLLTIGAAQDFLVKTIGGTGAVRDCYRTAFYVGGDAQTARVLLDVKGAVDDGQLGRGLAYLRSRPTLTAELVRVPLASNAALDRLLGAGYRQVAANAPQAGSGQPPGNQRRRGFQRSSEPHNALRRARAHCDAVSGGQ
jgi:hypothetical protein